MIQEQKGKDSKDKDQLIRTEIKDELNYLETEIIQRERDGERKKRTQENTNMNRKKEASVDIVSSVDANNNEIIVPYYLYY